MENDFLDINSRIRDFIPIKISNENNLSYIDNILSDLKNIKNFNTAILSYYLLYIFILQSITMKVYSYKNYKKYIGLLDSTSLYREKHFLKDEKLNYESFQEVERDIVKFLFPIFKIDGGNKYCQNHINIVNIRNKVCHLNFELILKEEFDNFINDIFENFSYFTKRSYQIIKSIMYSELGSRINNNLITDETDLDNAFESINIEYYFSINDYRQLYSSKYLSIKDNDKDLTKKIKQYIIEYCKKNGIIE